MPIEFVFSEVGTEPGCDLNVLGFFSGLRSMRGTMSREHHRVAGCPPRAPFQLGRRLTAGPGAERKSLTEDHLLRCAYSNDDSRDSTTCPQIGRGEAVIRHRVLGARRSPPSILEGLDEILTVTRLGLPVELRRSLACTNIIENMNGTIRQVCRNVKRWRDAKMALRWTGAAMLEAAKGFRRLKAHKQLPILRAALAAHQANHFINPELEQKAKAA